MYKRILTRSFVILFFAIGMVSNVCAGDNAEEIISKLQKKYNSIKDVTIDFTQNVRFGVTKSEQTFSGKLLMKKENKYRIELEQQTIVTDGKSVWTYSKLNGQVFIDTYRNDPKSFSPDKVLTNLPANYTAATLGKEVIGGIEAVIVKLVPKSGKSNIQWMKVWVDDDEWLMKKVQVQDNSDNLTTYSIESFKSNTSLSDALFQFQPPQDVEVIDLR